MTILGFPSIAALKRQAHWSWRSANPRRWNRTFWREANRRCGKDPGRWLDWLLEMEAKAVMNFAGPGLAKALESLSPERWQYHYRTQLLERILADPWGLKRLQDEFQEIYSNGTSEADWILGLEGEEPRAAIVGTAA